MMLTVREIIDLANFAGIRLASSDVPDDYLDDEFHIYENEKGFSSRDDYGRLELYRVAVRCDGCDFDEVYPIGEPMKNID